MDFSTIFFAGIYFSNLFVFQIAGVSSKSYLLPAKFHFFFISESAGNLMALTTFVTIKKVKESSNREMQVMLHSDMTQFPIQTVHNLQEIDL